MNRARSVADRLVAISRLRKEDHHLVLVRYGGERLLERISRHPLLSRFVLKGATLFLAWEGVGFRATRDIDLLGYGSSDLEVMRILFGEICREDTSERDGLRFDENSVDVSRIKEDQLHEGTRVRLVAFLERTRIPLQVDIGFGDAITPAPRAIEFPTLLGEPPIRLLGYPFETVFAEKLAAIDSLGMVNTRMKDYHDLVVLARNHSLDLETCASALLRTCEARMLDIPRKIPVGLTEAFAREPSRERLWRSFQDRTTSAHPMGSLVEVVHELAGFVGPILDRLPKKS